MKTKKLKKSGSLNKTKSKSKTLILNKIISKNTNIDYKIAVPTYKRYDTFKNKTFKLLTDYKIPSKNIYIFVANNEEKVLYEKVLDKSKYNKIIVGKKGLKNQRNFISNYFNEGAFIIQLDDDLDGLYTLKDKNNIIKTENKLIKLPNLEKLIYDAYGIMKKYDIYLFGIYPVHNPFFMSNKITTKLKFIVGPFFGIINRKNKKFKLDFDEKEDVLRTLIHYKEDSRVLRFNNVCLKTSYYKEQGGMQAEKKDRKVEALKSAHILIKRYPNFTKLNLTKKSGHPEVRLYDKTPKYKNINIKL